MPLGFSGSSHSTTTVVALTARARTFFGGVPGATKELTYDINKWYLEIHDRGSVLCNPKQQIKYNTFYGKGLVFGLIFRTSLWYEWM